MKVLDVIEECQNTPRETPKENTPAVGNVLSLQTQEQQAVNSSI